MQFQKYRPVKLKITYMLLILLALIGFKTLLYTTDFGIGISPDSVSYISAARNLLNGHGLSIIDEKGEVKPMTHFPPLLSVLLSVFGRFGIDPLTGARWFNAIIFGINIFLFGFAISKCTDGALWSSVLGSFIMLTSTCVLSIHSTVLTEPLFILFTLVSLLVLASYIESKKKSFLVIASVSSALASLSRYPGLVVIATGAFGMLLLSRKPYAGKVPDVTLYSVFSSLPITVWTIRNLLLTGNTTNREIAFHPINFNHIKSSLDTFSSWLLPWSHPIIILVIFLTLIFVAFSIWKHQLIQPYIKILIFLLSAFSFFYLIFLTFSISFIDASTPLNDRILSPIFISGGLLILVLAHKRLQLVKRANITKIIYVLLFLTVVGSYLCRGISWVIHAHNEGLGYAGKVWQDSQLLKQIEALPTNITIFTNAHDAIHFFTGRSASMIPPKFDRLNHQIRSNYMAELSEMRNKLESRNGVIIYFNNIGWRRYLPSEEELMNHLPLRPYSKAFDGTIYVVESDFKKSQ